MLIDSEPQSDTRREKRSVGQQRCDIVCEEAEAWRRGEGLAREIGAVVSAKKFHETRVSCLRAYFRWALKRGPLSDPV